MTKYLGDSKIKVVTLKSEDEVIGFELTESISAQEFKERFGHKEYNKTIKE